MFVRFSHFPFCAGLAPIPLSTVCDACVQVWPNEDVVSAGYLKAGSRSDLLPLRVQVLKECSQGDKLSMKEARSAGCSFFAPWLARGVTTCIVELMSGAYSM